jgi:hypothetical protein
MSQIRSVAGGLCRVLVFAVAAVIGLSTPAAANTGTISGAVFNQDGMPVANAVVAVSGAAIPAGRTTRTDPNGVYHFEYLPPGDYAVTVTTAGTTITRNAIVELGRDTRLEFVTGLAFTEFVTVNAVRPVVDFRSAEVSFNFSSDTLSTLPLERTYRGMFQLLPGVGENRSTVGPAAGGGRQDNTYLMDGANIGNPGFGHLATEINELDIAEVNMKRAGISAAFGRTGGTVMNAISRRGSNLLSGIARMDWLPEGLVAAYELPDDVLEAGVRPGTFRDPLLTTRAGPAIGVGGPVVRDKVFFYVSGRYLHETKWDRLNKVDTPLPDEVRRGHELFGKLSAVPTPQHQFNVGFRNFPSKLQGAGLDSNTAPSVGTRTENGNRVATADWAFFISARRSLNLRYLHMRESNEDTPVNDLGYLPPFDPGNLEAMGQYNDPSRADLRVGGTQYTTAQNYRRHEAHGIATQLFDVGRTSHTLKAGAGVEFGEEHLDRTANGWGLITNVTEVGVPALRTRYFTTQPPQLGRGLTYSVFVQDDVQLGARTSVSVGVLLNRDEFSQHLEGSGGCPASIALQGGAAVYESNGDTCTFLRFGFTDEIQPRLGISYQLREGQGDKVYGSWGRYYNMDQKSSGRSLAPARLFQTQTVFDLAGNVLSSGPLASTTGKLIDPAIEPIFTDEFVLGYATPIRGTFSLDVYFISRAMRRFIEDLPSRMNGTSPIAGPYVAANLPCTAFDACRSADARRTYRALTVDLRHRLTDGWFNDVSYTWSRFHGNYDLDFGPVATFNTSSFIQDGPGTNVEDPNRLGPLLEDRPHVLKVFTSYAVTSRLTASGYLRIQSGTPWAARGRDWAGSVLNYLEPAGSHRNPTWSNLDLMASYRVPLTGRAAVSLEARVLNVFNAQTQLSTDSQQYLDFRSVLTPPFFAPYQDPNPFFGTGNAFAPPRRLFLASVFTF